MNRFQQPVSITVGSIASFEARSLVTLRLAGQPCWLAGEIAAILGLDGAAEVVRLFALDCAELVVEGEHWARIGPHELAELLIALDERGVVPPLSLSEATSAIVLLEPGVARLVEHVGAELEGAGARLLQHLRSRVIPLIARRNHSSTLARAIAAITRDRIELERRRGGHAALEQLCEQLEAEAEVDPQVVWAYRVSAAEVAIGAPLWPLKPVIEHGWLSPTQIAERHLGVSPQRVGQVITRLGLRGSEVHSKAVLNKAVGRAQTVITHLYSPAAVEWIERELEHRGYRRVA